MSDAAREQVGPICPNCKKLPCLEYGVIDDVATNGDHFKITYCENCKFTFNVQYVGKDAAWMLANARASQKRIKIAANNPAVDLRKVPIGMVPVRGRKQ